jgi:heavy metal sensor kinase
VGLTIRWRLTLWNSLAVAVVLACFAAIIYGLLWRTLIDQTDRYLASAIDQLHNDSKIANDLDGRLDHWAEEFKDHLNLLSAIYRADGSVQASTPGMDASIFPRMSGETLNRQRQFVDLDGFGRYRMVAERVRIGGREFGVVLLSPMAEIDRELALVRSVMIAAVPVALLLSGAFGYVLARKALAPINHLRRATDAITADQLDRRLPVPNPKDELGQLTRTINNMIGRLERSFAEIRRFTADASHELRTPLTVLRTEVEVALRKPLSATEHQQLLGCLLDELERMTRLTDQLLTLSRRDAGVEQFVPVVIDLKPLVASVVEALLPLAGDRGISLSLQGDGPVEIMGDESRLRQVFINLIDNAVKYTGRGGTVTVRLAREGDKGIAIVEDTGIGISPENLPRVFDRFFRADKARTRMEGGTGLGLSIAQSIIQAHGGKIELESVLNVGTRCKVTLPTNPDVLAP